MTDEERRDKQQQMLDDHHHDLWHEEALANCDHEDFTIEAIDEATSRYTLSLEVTCDFCEKTGRLDVSLKDAVDVIESSTCYSTSWPVDGISALVASRVFDRRP